MNHPNKRTWAVRALVCGAVGAGLMASTAAAADNTKMSGSVSFTATRLCVDPIRISESWDEQMHTYYDKDGNATRLAFTGKVEITYRNLTTDATYSPNSSGPGTIDLQTGQNVIRGSNGAILDSNGDLIATDGRIVLDADGNVISIVGHQNGVCEMLGSSPAP